MSNNNILDHYVLQKNKKIKKIYHIADIHIRKYERHQEYEQVFKRLYKRIKEDNDNALIVCCGDILHEGISGDAIIMVKNFFINLCDICDVVVFKGNHDLASRSNIDAIDSLTPILMKLNTKNKLHVLDNRGLYEYGNLIFGYTTMYDNDVISPDGFDNKIKIALWHGIIHGCTNDDGYSLSNNSKFNQNDFSDYDYTMLGDVHKFQYLNKNKTIAYSGSLIQQNHGENINNHGCIKWDLVKKKSFFIHIDNNYGFLTVRIEKNKISSYDPEDLPENINLKIILKRSDDKLAEKVKKDIEKYANIEKFNIEKIENAYSLEDITFTNTHKMQKENSESSTSESDESNNVKPIGVIKNNSMAIDILNNYIDKYHSFSKKEKKEINLLINELMENINYEYSSNEKHIKLKNIWFNNFNVYSNDNFINYQDLHGIINVCGPNGIGKSSASIFVLLYAIYGNYDNISKHDYINVKKKNMNTKIIVDVNETEYTIEREEWAIGKNKIEYKSNVKLLKNGIDISGKSILEIEKQIIKIFGESNELINLCIMSQRKCSSFIDLSDNEKKKFLCDILKLDIYNNIGKEATNQIRTINAKMNDKYKYIYDKPKNKSGDKEKILKEKEKDIKQQIKKLETKIVDIEKEYNKINAKKIEYELYLKDNKNIKKNYPNRDFDKEIEKLNDDIETKTNQFETLNKKKNELDDEKNEINKKLENYKKMNIEMKYKNFLSKKEKDIEHFDNQIKLFCTQKIIINKKININNVKKRVDELQKQIEHIKNNVLNDFNDINDLNIDNLKDDIQILYDTLTPVKHNRDVTETKKYITRKISKLKNDIEKIYLEKPNISKLTEKKYEEACNIKKEIDTIDIHLIEIENKKKQYNYYETQLQQCDFNNKCPKCKLNIKILDNLMTDTKNNNDKEYDKLNDKRSLLSCKYDKLKKHHDTWLLYIELSNKENEIIENIEIYEEKLNILNNNNIKNTINEKNEIIKKIKLASETKQQLEILENELHEKKILLDNNEKNNKLDDKILDAEESLKSIKSIKYEEYDNYLDCNKSFENINKNINKITSQINETKLDIEKIKLDLYKITDEKIKYDEISDKIKKYKIYENKYNTIQETYDEISDNLDEIKKELNTNTINLTKIKCDIEVIKNTQNEISELQNMKNNYEKIAQIISGGFVDKLLTESVIPKFMSSVNSILSSFVSFQIKMIHEDNKRIVVYKDDMTNVLKLSGYESLMVNVAFRLAINQVNKRIRTNFFIMDESFSFCDDKGISKVSNLFEYMRELYDWVIVVSHNDQIKTYTDIDLQIEKHDHGSYVNTNKYTKKNTLIKHNANLIKKNTQDVKKKKIVKTKK